MMSLLKSLYYKAEELKGARLVLVLAIVFVAFLLIGVGINYYTNQILNSHENGDGTGSIEKPPEKKIVEKNGIITSLGPNIYEDDEVRFYLATVEGKEIILLRADDQKLDVAEGLYVTVIGTEGTILNDVPVLDVNKVLISQN